jgi:hypothetical protein
MHYLEKIIKKVSIFHFTNLFTTKMTKGIAQLEFDEKIHFLRGNELKQLNLSGSTAIHVGCSGSWYFNWIHENVKHSFANHIGIEKYSEIPSNLPSNVDWIESCAGSFKGVASNTVDWVYSGQNLEHLWEHDFIDFFLEAARVTREGGVISLDSPNTVVTEQLGWNHPQHTAEFEVTEVIQLLEYVGFEILDSKGIYRADFSSIKPSEFFLGYPDARMENHAIETDDDFPNESFVYWINAKKTGKQPDSRYYKTAQSIFRKRLTNRLNRFQDSRWHRLKYEENGVFNLVAGGYSPATLCLALPEGQSIFKFTFFSEDGDAPSISIHVNNLRMDLYKAEKGTWENSITINLDDAQFGVPVSIEYTELTRNCKGVLEVESKVPHCH